jgi:mono/diheme cytochrome c family protein
MYRLFVAASLGLLLAASAPAADPAAAARGRKALDMRAFNPKIWALSAYDEAWRQWGSATEPPATYGEVFREHYGLHAAPYANGKYPMGLREADSLLGKGLTADCLLCHGGSILGKSYIGLGNASLDAQAVFEDLNKASFGSGKLPHVFSHVRGTSEAGSMAVFLLSHREPDLSLRLRRLDLGLRDDMCEDTPAWWLLKKKKTLYHTGTGDARSVRTLMPFMLLPGNGPAEFERAEAAFADIQAFLRTLDPPKFPYPVDRALARQGEMLFGRRCAKCHGTYGKDWTYPNRIVPIDVIDTDRKRFEGFSERFGEHYNRSWFAHEKGDGYRMTAARGYQAPPLDGIWATAPYLHNGSVPTVYHVLNSKARPKIFTRSYRTDAAAYDAKRLGWKVTVLTHGPDRRLPAYERRKVYDTTQPGRGNGGHRFGDDLSEDERWAVIEYLKTL